MSQEFDVLPSYGAMVEFMGSHIKSLAEHQPLQILEAGCGRSWPFKSLGTACRITGVDLDEDALAFRKNTQKDLDDARVGDLRTVTLPADFFHVIYCSYVLEHVKGVEHVLDNFVRWLRVGGLLIISVPDARSLSGFLTRYSPHWFHVLVYRHIIGNRLAGTPGHGPYRTYYERAMSAAGMKEFASRNNLAVKAIRGAANQATLRFPRILGLAQYASFGKLRADYADIVFVMQKQPPAF